jgi:transposase
MDYGYRNVGFIFDRGYFSKENIRYLDTCGYSFVMMVKGVKAIVSELILSLRGTFETDRDCLVREYKAYGKTVKTRLYADDDRDRYFHIFHTQDREHAESEQLEARIEQLGKYLKKQEGRKRQFGDGVRDYFSLEYAKDGETFLFAQERKNVIELKLCGYFAIVTSEEMTATDALTLYRIRDESEKLFRGDKSYLGNRPARVYSDESASAKIFIEFIALILRNKLYTYLKSAVLKNEKKANYMSVPAAVRELEKLEMIRLCDGVYRLDHAVDATQKAILSAFGLDEDSVKQETNRLSEELKKLK